MVHRSYDLAVIGGGINGAGIARDAAGRGLSVLLCEQGDLAGATSSASTKLVHGGLRYLEQFELRLVREALIEREVLLRNAPHIIRPLRFVLPHHQGLRPAWMIRLGLFLYDHLGRRDVLPASRALDLTRDVAGQPLKPQYKRGFEYSDCWVDDSRLVVLNALGAAEQGADIRTRTKCVAATQEGPVWTLALHHTLSGKTDTVQARGLVNAAGPWVSEFLSRCAGRSGPAQMRLVKGSHIIVPRLFEHDRAYIFQNADKRIVFAIPYEHDFTLIGTTDIDFEGDPAEVSITEAETAYLCQAVSEYFAKAVVPGDVVHSFAGVRPLYDDHAKTASSATRDYVLELEDEAPPLLSVFGGKITTYRRLAETALAKLRPFYPEMGPSWTAHAPLPGGDFPVGQVEQQIEALLDARPELSVPHARRLVRAYGTRAEQVLDALPGGGLGECFGADLYECEAAYLVDREWAMTPEDILWRRTKLELHTDHKTRERLTRWLQERTALRSTTAA